MNPIKTSYRNDLVHLVRGLLMGCADVVPGVSGGTVALIVGIYGRLISAINHFDIELLRLLKTRQWKKGAEHIDLRFLVALGCGIVAGVVAMSLAMHFFMATETTRTFTFSAFFGMILASAVLVTLMIKTRSAAETTTCVILGIIAGAAAYWIATLQSDSQADLAPSYPYLFLCGAIAICAMILPGISGAMILLLLGVYLPLTAIPHSLLHGENISGSLITLLVFGAGCSVGLLGFSKVLRWLLTQQHATTMAALCGFMFGALRKLWPFQEPLPPFVDDIKRQKFDVIWPEAIDGYVLAVAGVALAGMAMVFLVDRCTKGHTKLPKTDSPCLD